MRYVFWNWTDRQISGAAVLNSIPWPGKTVMWNVQDFLWGFALNVDLSLSLISTTLVILCSYLSCTAVLVV